MANLQTVDRALSEIYFLVEHGKFEEAQNKRKETLEISEKAIETATSKDEKARIQLKRGIIYNDLGDLPSAYRSFSLALAIFSEIGNTIGEIDVYNEFARIHFVRSEYDSSINYLKMSIALSEKIEYYEGMAKAIANRGRVYTLKGDLQLAEKDLLFGIKAHEEIGKEVNLSNDLQSLGYVYYLERRFEEAKERLEESYAIIQGKGWSRDEAVYHEFSGALASAQGEFALAHEHYYKVFEIMEPKASQCDMMSQTYRLLAELQIAEGEYDESLSSCKKGMEIAEKIRESIEVGAIHRVLGQIYTAKGDQQKAKEHFEKSISVLKEIRANYELGLTYIEAGRSVAFGSCASIVHLGNAMEIFKEMRVPYYVEESSTMQTEITGELPIIQMEELNGYVERIIDDKAYVVFETNGGPLERVVKLSKLEAIKADRQGALIRLVVEERGASMNVKFENLEEKGIATWRDRIKDADLEKYDLLRKFAIPPKPSKLQ